MDRKFENIKQDLLQDLKTTIISEITNSILQLKLESVEMTNSLMTEQKDTKQEINKINIHIKDIEAENIKLKAQLHEIHNMRKGVENRKHSQEDLQDQDYTKKYILYGLSENSWENEHELHERVISIFHDILHVNLVGCIDDMKRLGDTDKEDH